MHAPVHSPDGAHFLARVHPYLNPRVWARAKTLVAIIEFVSQISHSYLDGFFGKECGRSAPRACWAIPPRPKGRGFPRDTDETDEVWRVLTHVSNRATRSGAAYTERRR